MTQQNVALDRHLDIVEARYERIARLNQVPGSGATAAGRGPAVCRLPNDRHAVEP